MKKPVFINGIKKAFPMLLVSALITSVGIQKVPAAFGNTPKRFPILAACTRFEYNLFRDAKFQGLTRDKVRIADSDVEKWRKTFHGTVSEVVEEHMEYTPPDCTGTSHAQAFVPKDKLTRLAHSLPSWRTLTWQLSNEGSGSRWWDIFNLGSVDWKTVNTNSLYLSQLDIGTVLMEYLRMYECALVERSYFLSSHTLDQETRREEALGLSNLITLLDRSLVTLAAWNDREAILEELLIARRSIHRTVTLLGGYNRFGILNMELQCLQQASLDARNGLALAADAASCMPRIWNAKDTLRDYKEDE
jgi:hypothetical protein